jgi:hypothetical protein
MPVREVADGRPCDVAGVNSGALKSPVFCGTKMRPNEGFEKVS